MPCQGKNGTARSLSKREVVEKGKGWMGGLGGGMSAALW